MGPTKFDSIDALLAYCEEVERTQPAYEAARSMSTVYADCDGAGTLATLDPFSDHYAQAALRLYNCLAAVSDYNPLINERTPYIDLARTIASPTPYQYGDSVTVADFMLSWGWILKNLDVRAGGRVLEYGAGEGQLSMHLARMGCDVSIVDIEERYLEAVQAQCQSLGVRIHTNQGQFGEAPQGQTFDRIIFFEAFHHALDHANLLAKLRGQLADGGFILFAGEPVVELDNPFVPFAWGPRLDGISVRSTRKFGWCELGFQRPYFVERLMRSGYLVQHVPCPATGRGDCFIARPAPLNQDINLAEPWAIEVHGRDSGWHQPEHAHRWTKYKAVLPVPDGTSSFEAQCTNHLPVQRRVTVTGGGEVVTKDLRSGERARLAVPVHGRHIDLFTDQHSHRLHDARELGIAVEAIRFCGAVSIPET